MGDINSKIVDKIRHTRWLEVLSKHKGWLEIKLANGKKGYVKDNLVTSIWIRIYKKEKQLSLMQDRSIIKNYKVAFGFDPVKDKIRQGDGCTPHGRFYICEVINKPKPAESYGPVSLRISYPNIEDARRGLHKKLINKKQYLRIIKAIHKGVMPPQNTILGSSIKIHGGKWGVNENWTLGCVAMTNKSILELYAYLPPRLALVDIYSSKAEHEKRREASAMNRRIIKEAKHLLKRKCSYTKAATNIIRIDYPMGDFDKSIGVCTDVVIRALRRLGIDLQALLYEDIINFPARYRNIKRPDTNIDHRRCRNLQVYFQNNAEILTTRPPAECPADWKSGDIVIMDTGINNGTLYDHIGIVSSTRFGKVPLVINSWSIGHELNEMELLDGRYPKIVAHYRLFDHLYYDSKDRK